jgi:hypothetical protein
MASIQITLEAPKSSRYRDDEATMVLNPQSLPRLRKQSNRTLDSAGVPPVPWSRALCPALLGRIWDPAIRRLPPLR